MYYILLLVIVIAILYFKLKDFGIENFTNFSLINDVGLSIETRLNEDYIIASGEKDTPYHLFSLALNDLSSINVSPRLTAGSLDNLDLVSQKKVDFAFCQEDILYDKVLGLNEYKGKKLPNIRFVCAMFEEYYFLIVPKTSNISSFTGLKNGFSGKGSNYIIGTGPEGSGSLENLKIICKLLTIKLIKINIGDTLSQNEAGALYYITESINTNFNLLLNNKIDALFYVNGVKMNYILNLSQLLPIKFIPCSGTQFNILNQIVGNKNRERDINVSENMITSEESPNIKTQSVRSVIVCHQDLDESLVYNFLKDIFNNVDYLKYYMMNLKNINNNFISSGTVNTNDTVDWLQPASFSFVDSFKDSYIKQFKPLEMAYVNKNIFYHKGAKKLYNELGYITTEGNFDCKYDKACNLVPYLNKKNYYWKYEKIPALEAEFKR